RIHSYRARRQRDAYHALRGDGARDLYVDADAHRRGARSKSRSGHPRSGAAHDRQYANSILGFQVTGGSTSIRAAWLPLRHAGAVARVLLISAGRRTWGVDPMSCRAEAGQVIHVPTGRTLRYGDVVDIAATLQVHYDVPLKDPKDFKLIGTPAKRLDTPHKVNGRALFSIDVQIPGMKIATVAACPVFGGK